MNRNFIILLLSIFVIGILYYFIKKEGFEGPLSCLDLTFNTDDKSRPYNEIFTKAYTNNIIITDPRKYKTFMNSDFDTQHIKAISRFLGLRDKINTTVNDMNAKDGGTNYAQYLITHKMMVLFNSDIDKYLEINFNNLENTPIIKIIYNHETKKLKIENTLLTESPPELDLNNGFGNSIEFSVITLKRNAAVTNQFRFIINGNMYCYTLPPGIDNHFYNNLKNITVYPTNTNNYFRISHTCTGEIYTSYSDIKIRSQRIPTNSYDYSVKGTNIYKPFNLLRPNTPAGYLPLGSYYINNLGNANTNPRGALILEANNDYVRPTNEFSKLGFTNKWDNDGKSGKGGRRGAGYQFTLLNAKDMTDVTVKGNNYNFRALGGVVIDNKPIDGITRYPQVALVREDCLKRHPSGPTVLWEDKGSGAQRDGSIWTYNLADGPDLGHPGQNLAVFQAGYGSPYPELNWVIKDECLSIQPRLLSGDEKKNIDALVIDSSNAYEKQITDAKREKDSVVNPNLQRIMTENDEKINKINSMIGGSKSIYDIDYQANKEVYDMQDKYNQRYDFLNLLNTQLNPIKDNEIKTYTNNGLKASQVSSLIDNSLYMPGLLKESNNKFISETGNTNDLIKQYELQRQNEQILRVIGEQISK